MIDTHQSNLCNGHVISGFHIARQPAFVRPNRLVRRGSVLAVLIALMADVTVSQTTQWQGAVSSDWFNPANWSNGIPSNSTSTIVSQGMPSRFDAIAPVPSAGDTAQTGSLILQNAGHIRLEFDPAPGALIVHGPVDILNGSGLFVRDGRVEFHSGVVVGNDGVLHCGSGAVVLFGTSFEVKPNGILIVDNSSTQTMANASTSFIGDMQLANLEVKNKDTLFIYDNVHVVGVLEVGAGRVVFVKNGGLLTVGGPVNNAGSIVYESALPVQLSALTAVASQQGVLLRWRTETEENNYGFEIERRAIANVELPISNWNGAFNN